MIQLLDRLPYNH